MKIKLSEMGVKLPELHPSKRLHNYFANQISDLEIECASVDDVEKFLEEGWIIPDLAKAICEKYYLVKRGEE